MDLGELAKRLRAEDCSCVIYNHGVVRSFHQRGVKDLYELLKSDPAVLDGALIADKVVGKGAAALMIAGRARDVYAEVISVSALELFASSSTGVSYGQCVDAIINRQHTGPCPVETLCLDCATAEECIPLIENFIKNQK